MSAAGRTPSRSLFEREGELAVLRAALTAAASGDGRLVVIEGGIGIGKTRLLREAQTLAADMGLRSLHARGGELERDFAFGAVRQLFEPVLAEASPVAREQLLSGAAALAEPVFVAPQLGERTEGLTDASFIVLHGLYWLAATSRSNGRPSSGWTTSTGSTLHLFGGSHISPAGSTACRSSSSRRPAPNAQRLSRHRSPS